MANRLSRLLVALLFTCLLTVGLGAPTTSSAVPSSTAPSASQASAVLSQNAVSGSNNPVALAINGLIKDAASLARVVASAAAWAQFALIKLFTPELIYSYGKSPPVYPSPQGAGNDGGWASAYSQAKALVAQMTDVEKANITFGISENKGCSGFTGSVPRLGFPGICLNDAESGVRTGKLVSGYPAQLHVGASWNRKLAGDRAIAIGKEFKKKGINVLLGPVVGPLGRVAKGGRNWEGFTNDPYLAGSLVEPTITGMQRSVVACVKHFIGNEQETNRSPFLQGFIPDLANESVSSNIDDRTMHEAYLWPFYDAVRAEAASIMCSYNKINGSYGCANSKTLNGLLKTELGFEGFVVSDWYAQHTGIASNNAGLDMVMPSSQFLNPNSLAGAVANGSVTADRLNDQATRILAAWYRFAKVDAPGQDLYANVDARDPADEATIFQSAVEGHVLVKNNGVLPLNKPATLNLFGYDAIGGSNTSGLDSTLYGFGQSNTRTYINGLPYTGLQALLLFASVLPAGSAGPEVALQGTMITGGGSGAITPVLSYAPYDAFVEQAAQDSTTLFTDFSSQRPVVRAPNDPCVIFINAASSEAYDRTTLADEYSDTLVTNVANSCKNTMVVIHNAGIRLVDRWIDHPNVTAVIYGHLPGQDSGLALTEIIYGRQSPSGRLPYTVGRTETDYGSLLNPSFADSKNPLYSQSTFSEGLYIDYKSFIQRGVAPRFPFGYGLTYSNFSYSALSISKTSGVNTSPLPSDHVSGSTPAPQGGLASLYESIATVTVTVSNTGRVAAAEVAQLYLGIPNSGLPKALRGFDKQIIQPGQSAQFSFPLRRRDLSIWDVNQQQWVLQAGSYNVQVGKSVENIVLTGSLTI
ncbi:putative beta-glucosidase M-3 [Elsinoe australis]|uniref:beta-glucosidase n=1 Tax=Elsinoe australis TaxID=40998 RepID=A0A4U7APY0_9PEZI|nr:putative beta-glucosidase M-3 [Elsinoe australis]